MTQERLVTLKKKNGFSLVEVLVALSIMGFISVSLISEIERSQKTVKMLEMKLEQTDFTTALATLTSTPDACLAAFSSVTIPPAALATALAGSPIDLPSDQILFQGHPLRDHKFDAYSAANLKFKVTAVPTSNTATGSLIIDLVPKSQAGNYPQLNNGSTVAFGLSVDATGAITSCPGTAPAAGNRFSATDCYVFDEVVAPRRSVTRTCNTDYAFLFATAFPGGRHDRVDSRYFQLSPAANPNSVRVSAGSETWRLLAKCCKQN